MKKLFLILAITAMLPLCVTAQSSMTDEQVMKFVVKEHNSGTSQAQIVTKLMQQGVNIEQIRRVRKKYERLAKEEGLGTTTTKDTRLRTSKNKTEEIDDQDKTTPQYRVKDSRSGSG